MRRRRCSSTCNSSTRGLSRTAKCARCGGACGIGALFTDRPRRSSFEQQHEPGREAAVDFTDCRALGVTVAGSAFPHLLFHLVPSFSGWTWVSLAFGETFEALVAGVQGALWKLGGVPRVLRSDNLSAATHELKDAGGRSLTKRFRAVLEHDGLESTRIRPGESHETASSRGPTAS
ncbi:MAG: DDE-type integrase/transposase/recombinase [Polyangiaceae bacterium]|nr:DDE-type integrase/transposase/recombinase [Polyangiaceae bacterium]